MLEDFHKKEVKNRQSIRNRIKQLDSRGHIYIYIDADMSHIMRIPTL